mmetsp:Transcript_46971/g.119816  ORF Transcript_46971/g.119816 Transcript_46971/m.119816 type:complete len:231 (+) Transcript_46971:351-1043(+)
MSATALWIAGAASALTRASWARPLSCTSSSATRPSRTAARLRSARSCALVASNSTCSFAFACGIPAAAPEPRASSAADDSALAASHSEPLLLRSDAAGEARATSLTAALATPRGFPAATLGLATFAGAAPRGPAALLGVKAGTAACLAAGFARPWADAARGLAATTSGEVALAADRTDLADTDFRLRFGPVRSILSSMSVTLPTLSPPSASSSSAAVPLPSAPAISARRS